MPNIVSDQTTISDAESTTGWSGDSFSLENQIFVQGANSVAVIQTGNGVNDVLFTIAAGSWDMTGSHVRMFMSSNIMPNTDIIANGGIQMFIGDGTNTAFFNIGGSDTYSGGWADFFLDPSSTPASGSVNVAAVTNVGLRINTTTKPRNATNGWYDNWRFGNGLTINSTAAEAISFQDVANEDALIANAWDILDEVDGVFFGKGKLILGAASGALNCNLVSLNETIFFIDRVVSTSLYAIVAQQGGTGTTDIDIEGLVCKTVGISAAEFTMPSTIASCRVVGSTFIGMGAFDFSKAGTITDNKFNDCDLTNIADGVTLTTNTWILSDQIDTNATGKLDLCVIDSSIAASAVLSAKLDDITKCSFISGGTGHAVELTTVGSGTMSWDNTLTGYAPLNGSTGNEDIWVNVGSGTLTISVVAGASIPSIRTAGATVSVVTGLSKLTFVFNPLQVNYEYRIYKVTARGSLAGQVEQQGAEQTSITSILFEYSDNPGDVYALQVLPHSTNTFKESVTYYDSTPTDQAPIINLIEETNS